MSTPWDKLFGAAREAEMRGDLETAADLSHAGRVLEKNAERTAAANRKRAGSNAFRSDAEEKSLREDNQRRFYGGTGRGR